MVDETVDSVRTPAFFNLLNAERVVTAFRRTRMQAPMTVAGELIAEVREARESV